MNPVFIFAIPFVLIPLGLFYLFGAIIVYHLKKYSLDKSYARRLILGFCLGLAAISCLVIVRFVEVDWKRVNIDQFIEDSAINIFYGNYDPR